MERININHQIRSRELRVITQDGQNLGVLSLEEAIKKAGEAGLDLIEISPTAKPPVAKIMDRGKFLYDEDKKRRQAAKKRKEVEIKSIRLGIGTGNHDLELKARRADEFLKEGNKIQIELRLKGREKYLDKKFLEDRIHRLLNLLTAPFAEEQIRKGPRGINMIISPKK